MAGRDGAKAEALGKELTAAGHERVGVAMDANDVASIREATDKAAQHMGRLDILVNCIGMNREQKIADVTEDQFDEIYRVNLQVGDVHRAAGRQVPGRGARGGKQVHMLSVRSMLGMRGYGYSAYCSTKGALVMLVKQHALELAAHNIQVNGVAPTVVETAMARQLEEGPGPLGGAARAHSARARGAAARHRRRDALLLRAGLGLRDGADPLPRRRDHGDAVNIST